MDDMDRALINHLQGGFPLSQTPYAEVGAHLGLSEDEVMQRIDALLRKGVLTRFGPMYHAERLGGGLSLCAMAVPEERFDDVAELVNGYAEVAHNYARQHRFNMWFVLATEQADHVEAVIADIERRSGLTVYNMPKLKEFYVGLRLEA